MGNRPYDSCKRVINYQLVKGNRFLIVKPFLPLFEC